MNFTKFLRFMPIERKNQIQKVIDTLRMGGRSEKTIDNYVCAINRFLKYFENKDLSKLNEDDIVEYIRNNYLNKKCSTHTYNMNICAIKYFYTINFRKEFNNKLLPRAKVIKRIPTVIDKETFNKIFNNEPNIKHKCWLLLAYTSGLRVEEIANLKIEYIDSNKNQLRVFGKRKKERFTVLTNVTIEYLRQFYKTTYYYPARCKTGYLFEGNQSAEHVSSKTISNYFTALKHKYDLPENMTFHSLRHSFASNFIKAGGDPFILKSMMGHSALSTTSIYIHMGRNFNNLKGVNYDEI